MVLIRMNQYRADSFVFPTVTGSEDMPDNTYVYLCILTIFEIRFHVIASTYDLKKMKNMSIGVKLRLKGKAFSTAPAC